VLTPTKLNKEQSELLRNFSALRNEALDKVNLNSNNDHGFFGKFKRVFK
jgi:DnaJ-class molecular chaperone